MSSSAKATSNGTPLWTSHKASFSGSSLSHFLARPPLRPRVGA
jgi:hypothetical protein